MQLVPVISHTRDLHADTGEDAMAHAKVGDDDACVNYQDVTWRLRTMSD